MVLSNREGSTWTGRRLKRLTALLSKSPIFISIFLLLSGRCPPSTLTIEWRFMNEVFYYVPVLNHKFELLQLCSVFVVYVFSLSGLPGSSTAYVRGALVHRSMFSSEHVRGRIMAFVPCQKKSSVSGKKTNWTTSWPDIYKIHGQFNG